MKCSICSRKIPLYGSSKLSMTGEENLYLCSKCKDMIKEFIDAAKTSIKTEHIATNGI